MIGGDRVLGVIAARGGSRGLPRKNLRELAGKPLIAWSVEAAAQSQLLDRAIVSTDDGEIAETARRFGADVPFLRPAELATDSASIVDAVIHASGTLKENYRYIVLLQATSPLRQSPDIDNAIRLCKKTGAPSCVSVTASPKLRWVMEMDSGKRLAPILGNLTARRQELRDLYQPNGAVYVADLAWLKESRNFYAPETVGYVMPAERSVDIDTELDFMVASALKQK